MIFMKLTKCNIEMVGFVFSMIYYFFEAVCPCSCHIEEVLYNNFRQRYGTMTKISHVNWTELSSFERT